jgi:predicted double-glycine peptidase
MKQNLLKQLLSKKKTIHLPVLGNTYAVHTGTYAGEMLIFVGSDQNKYNFLAVPTMLNRSVPITSFELAWNTDIIQYVEQVPDYVADISIEQYKKNEESNNRWEQSDTSNFLDS